MLTNLLSNVGLIYNLLSCVTPSCGTSTVVTSLLLQSSTMQRHSTPAITVTTARYPLLPLTIVVVAIPPPPSLSHNVTLAALRR